MKILALAILALGACASAGYAKPRPQASARETAAATRVISAVRKAAVATTGRDGPDAVSRCSAENPNIEYRDCVNASTRDPNTKVRLG